MNHTTTTQLDLLKQIDKRLQAASIAYWLRGGWAIDFLLGQITRSHSDIDLVAKQQDAARLRTCLEPHGFVCQQKFNIQLDFAKAGQTISVVFVTIQKGQITVDGIPEWVWLPDALSFPPQQLQRLSCRVLSPQQLLQEKETYQQGTGRPLRPKDRHSIRTLRQYLGWPD